MLQRYLGCQLDVTALVNGEEEVQVKRDGHETFCSDLHVDLSATPSTLTSKQRVLQGREVGGAVSEPALALAQAQLAHIVARLLEEQHNWTDQTLSMSDTGQSSSEPARAADNTDIIVPHRQLEVKTATPQRHDRIKARSAKKNTDSKKLLKQRAQVAELIAAELRSLDDPQVCMTVHSAQLLHFL